MSDSKPLFSHNSHATQSCPKCDKPLIFRQGKAGPFLGCSGYPQCLFIQPLHPEHDFDLDKVIEGSECPECQSLLAVKHGRYGIFIGCSNYPTCHFTEQKEQKEESSTNIQCPKCHAGELIKKQNRFGKFFFACSTYPSCNYLLNSAPVAKTCEKCGWEVLIRKKLRGSQFLICPQKKCQHKHSSE
ncbi:topoisomerase DNA-binding C4 zinc finger domain-containing protein [Catenovulum sediminis]|uniref:Topoisomerase DNA-binding C4 zinc finger domain-containing protein n=2 Tax=Catenovulum sediminis TaxID=1740262 RepID=A0ABV1RE14_9ALTE